MPVLRIILVALAFATTVRPGAAQSDSILVGLLNEWGIGVPQAALLDGTWERIEDPGSFAELARRRAYDSRHQWHLTVGNASPTVIRGGPVVHFEDPYHLPWGILTNFPAKEVFPNRRPGTVGAIVSRPHALGGVQRLAKASPHFTALEDAVNAEEIDPVGPRFTVLAATLIPGSDATPSWIYFRSERMLGTPQDCRGFESVNGWYRPSGTDAGIHQSSRGTSDCDHKGAEFVAPMGVLEVAGRAFVIAEVAEWEWVGIEIFELSSTRVDRRLSPR